MKMSVTLSLLLSLFLLIHSSNGYDITQILNKYPDFSTFNSYLTQTNLASAINSRNTITVLVVDNANLAPLSSKSLDVIKNILSVHVLLDYYDVAKLQQLTAASPLPTTFFQTTGLAVGQQGFLNVTHPSADTVAFGSAMPGSTQGSSLVKSVAAEPYNISILQISNAIIPQGIDGAKTSAPAATTPPPPPPAPATNTSTPPAPGTRHNHGHAPAPAPSTRHNHGHSPAPSTRHGHGPGPKAVEPGPTTVHHGPTNTKQGHPTNISPPNQGCCPHHGCHSICCPWLSLGPCCVG
ncbi:fasciclin-like arabinogalactan protein 14 [Salvia miltiorrhiza]|uniref:fasciclin-like arabinogalactan protein 14 n=1 Tax=Salvia miltiorrhiza TaxID=226208 RepID=UPI0025ABF5EE|nr:fasciclin-like arabinogalactan protein 14 [Salvia miltiorrhiza]